MGKKEKKIVLDTNILISALLFNGELSKIVDLWKKGEITPVLSKETFDEMKHVLEYPKLSLTENEIKMIIEEEVLPFFEIVELTDKVSGICKDPDDNKFISCALSAKADFIITGDKEFYSLEKFKSVKIINASEFLRDF